MTVAYGRGAKGKATRLHSLIVRARGRCERCGDTRPDTLQCAHIVKRVFAHTRTDEANAFCLCASCHRHLENEPFEFVAFVVSRIGEAEYERLRTKAREGVNRKFDWNAEAARLEAVWKQMEAAA